MDLVLGYGQWDMVVDREESEDDLNQGKNPELQAVDLGHQVVVLEHQVVDQEASPAVDLGFDLVDASWAQGDVL